jgi:hypothetical protein
LLAVVVAVAVESKARHTFQALETSMSAVAAVVCV